MSHLHQVKTLEILVCKIFVAKRKNDVEQGNNSSLTSSRSATELEQICEMQLCVYSNEKKSISSVRITSIFSDF